MGRSACVAGVLICLAVLTSAAAEETPSPTGRISIDFKDAPLQRVADEISAKTGVNVILGPRIEKRLTLRLLNLHYTLVLKEIATRCDLVLVKATPNLYRLADPTRITLSFGWLACPGRDRAVKPLGKKNRRPTHHD